MKEGSLEAAFSKVAISLFGFRKFRDFTGYSLLSEASALDSTSLLPSCFSSMSQKLGVSIEIENLGAFDSLLFFSFLFFSLASLLCFSTCYSSWRSLRLARINSF